MKKLLALVLVGLLVAALAACGEKAEDTPAEPDATESGVTAGEIAVGGFTDAESPVITDEFKQVFDKATATLTGADIVPYAYIASQVVAGTNHLVLCKVTPTVPDAATAYALVTVYEDLSGNAEITAILDSEATAPAPYDAENPVSGGYGEPTTPEVTDEVKNALAKACETYAGVEFEAKALLGIQVVAGYNYDILCKATPVVPDAQPYYAVVTVYADLDGGAAITGVIEFDTDVEDDEVQSDTSTAD